MRIQKYTGGTWKPIAQTTVTSNRTYAVKVPVAAGENTFRAKASKPSSAAGYSTPVKVSGTTHRGIILYETNAYRKKFGLPALKQLSSLDRLAQAWTQAMYDTGNFNHNPSYFSQYPGSPKAGAENIASGTLNAMTSSNVVAQWMGSTVGHREIILGDWTHVGIGYVSVGGTAYATQNFARY